MADRNYYELKLGVLFHLRELYYSRTLTNEILPLEITYVAATMGVPEPDVQGAIHELVDLNLASPTNPMGVHFAWVHGECEITKEGLGYLHQVETAEQIPAATSSLRPAGFHIS